MSGDTQLLWVMVLGAGAAVLGVVVLLLGLLRESVRSLDRRVDGVWSTAVGVFCHTVTVDLQLSRAAQAARAAGATGGTAS